MFQLMCEKKKSYQVSHFLGGGGLDQKGESSHFFFFSSENFPNPFKYFDMA